MNNFYRSAVLILTFFLSLTYSSPYASGTHEAGAATETSWGLHTASFKSEAGEIRVYLPDDMSAGDTISGTVVAEAAGDTEEEKQRNSDTLSGFVVETEGGKARVADRILKVSIPATLTGAAALILTDTDGNKVTAADLPVNPEPPDIPEYTEFSLPVAVQSGRPAQALGSFDGNIDNTAIRLNGADLQILAESPRKMIAHIPGNLSGPGEFELIENGRVTTAVTNMLRVSLSADKLTLRRGETTTLRVQIEGLEGLDEPVTFNLYNITPEIVQMDIEGNVKPVTIRPEDISAGGVYVSEHDLTGITTGTFNILAKLQDCRQCRNIITTEEIVWGEERREGIKRIKEGEIFRVRRCEDPDKKAELSRVKIGNIKEETTAHARHVTRDVSGTYPLRTVTRIHYDRDGKVIGTREAVYDDMRARTFTKKDGEGKIVEEWKHENFKWYRKSGDEWIERRSGPRDLPERLR